MSYGPSPVNLRRMYHSEVLTMTCISDWRAALARDLSESLLVYDETASAATGAFVTDSSDATEHRPVLLKELIAIVVRYLNPSFEHMLRCDQWVDARMLKPIPNIRGWYELNWDRSVCPGTGEDGTASEWLTAPPNRFEYAPHDLDVLTFMTLFRAAVALRFARVPIDGVELPAEDGKHASEVRLNYIRDRSDPIFAVLEEVLTNPVRIVSVCKPRPLDVYHECNQYWIIPTTRLATSFNPFGHPALPLHLLFTDFRRRKQY